MAVRQSPLWKWATPGLSAALLLAVAWHVRHVDIRSAIPVNPLFWALLLAYWAAPIVSDFVIYRRLWAIPAEGLIALARKQVGNALLFDLLGETYFYSWARKKVAMETSPFGAVKDVTILSALVGNVGTLILMAAAWPYIGDLDLGTKGPALAASMAVLVAVSTLIIALGKRLFSLTRSELWWVSLVHLLRVFVSTALIAMAWAVYAPTQALGVWFLMATAQLVASRLPLFVNSDVVFASIVIWFLGKDSEIQQVISITTILIMLIHVAVAALLAVGDLATPHRKVAPDAHR
ncbi:MAG: hypothetical protein ABI673_06535 [Novosphingobium sp.]